MTPPAQFTWTEHKHPWGGGAGSRAGAVQTKGAGSGEVWCRTDRGEGGACSHHWPASHSPPSAARSPGWPPAPCRSCSPPSPPGGRAQGGGNVRCNQPLSTDYHAGCVLQGALCSQNPQIITKDFPPSDYRTRNQPDPVRSSHFGSNKRKKRELFTGRFRVKTWQILLLVINNIFHRNNKN